ncbi:MAG TPA: S8 family serine peptidase [Armatimonadota bacterium]|nr:S8 family serine peptidase [Armatimonadota bacterium]
MNSATASGGRAGLLAMGLGLVMVCSALADAAETRVVRDTDPHSGLTVECVADEILVGFAPGMQADEIAALHAQFGPAATRRIFGTNIDVVTLTAQQTRAAAIAFYARKPGVVGAELNLFARWHAVTPFTPNDPGYSQTYAFRLCNMDDAWGALAERSADPANPTIGGTAAILAILDSGFDLSHPDLASNYFTNPRETAGNGVDDDGNGFVDDVRGWDFQDNDNDPSPQAGATSSHGTACAGCAAAIGNNGIGIPGMVWRCQLIPVRVGNDSGSSVASAIAGINYAAAMGADVISMSFGVAGTSALFTSAITTAAALGADSFGNNPDRAGINFVASAGNDNVDMTGTPYYPVGSETNNEIIGVASVTSTVTRSDFSNYGTGVDIAAPGSAIYTTEMGSGYTTTQGTSFSAPYVAGYLTLLRALAPTLTANELRDILLESADADTLYSANPGFKTGAKLGAGLLEGLVPVQIVTEAPPDVSIETPSNGERLFNITPTIRVSAARSFARGRMLKQIVVEIDQERDPTGPNYPITRPGREAVVWTAAEPAVGEASASATYVVDPPLATGDSGATLHTLRIRVVEVDGRATYYPPVGETWRFRIATRALPRGARMISFPLALGQGGATNQNYARPREVLGAPVGRPGDAVIARWNPATGEYVRSDVAGEDDEYIRFFEPGKGYWVNSPTNVNKLYLRGLDLNEEVEVRDAPAGTNAGALLAPGWHQIGNPFPFAIALNSSLVRTESGDLIPFEVAVTRRLVRGTIFQYLPETGEYSGTTIPDAVLSPMTGYWLRTMAPIRLFLEPSEASVSGVSAASTRASAAVPNGWTVSLSASCGSAKDTTNAFGMAAKASSEYDEGLDMEEPPPVSSDLHLSFVHSDWADSGCQLSRDVVGPADTATWPVQVRTRQANAQVTLSWGDMRSVPREYSVYLVDSETGKIVSMRNASTYTFATGDTGCARQLEIRAERRVAGAGFRVDTLPATIARDGSATVSFRLSETAQVDCVIKNAAGRIVRRVAVDKTLEGGTRTLVWDGRTDTGSVCPRGMYTVEIVARNDRMERAHAVQALSR